MLPSYEEQDELYEIPKTGENDSAWSYVLIMAMAASVSTILNRKKKD